MKLPIGDVLYLSLRMTLAAYIIYHIGWLYGFIAVSCLNFTNNLLMKLLFGLEALSAVDEMFILDDDKNVANICSNI